MDGVSDRPSVSALRLVARTFGTLIALLALFGILGAVSDLASYRADRTVTAYLINAGFLMVFAGCVVGWFKDLVGTKKK